MRHARAARCTIRLEASDGALQLSIEDDGVGLAELEPRGVGLGSMRERAEELGGTFSVAPRATGGTRLDVMLPLVEAEPVR